MGAGLTGDWFVAASELWEPALPAIGLWEPVLPAIRFIDSEPPPNAPFPSALSYPALRAILNQEPA